MARKLQNRLQLAQFKTKHGWEDLNLDTIEPKVEAEIRIRPCSSGDMLSDSSSVSDFQYPRALMSSSPSKGPIFSDAIESGNSSGGPRKRHYNVSEFRHPSSSNGSRKRYRSTPTDSNGKPSWKGHHNVTQSSPIKPRKTASTFTHTGPNISFFQDSEDTQFDPPSSPNFAAVSDDDDNMLPMHSFQFPTSHHQRSNSPPRTPPPMRTRATLGGRRHHTDRSVNRGHKSNKSLGSAKEEGADLLLYLATSPSPANPLTRSRMHPPSTPPSRSLALPSSMMTTPGGGGGFFPNTPGQTFDFSDFVNITPSPAQGGARGLWGERTPVPGKTPGSIARRRLDFGPPVSPVIKRGDGLGMLSGSAL